MSGSRSLAAFVDDHDVRMVQGGRGAGLLVEADEELPIFGDLLALNLQCDFPSQPRITCAVDLSHPPMAEESQDPLGAEDGAVRENHRKLYTSGRSFSRTSRSDWRRGYLFLV